jgi:hypothetical protein
MWRRQEIHRPYANLKGRKEMEASVSSNKFVWIKWEAECSHVKLDQGRKNVSVFKL